MKDRHFNVTNPISVFVTSRNSRAGKRACTWQIQNIELVSLLVLRSVHDTVTLFPLYIYNVWI